VLSAQVTLYHTFLSQQPVTFIRNRNMARLSAYSVKLNKINRKHPQVIEILISIGNWDQPIECWCQNFYCKLLTCHFCTWAVKRWLNITLNAVNLPKFQKGYTKLTVLIKTVANFRCHLQFHTVLWHRWLGGRWAFQPVKRNGTIYPSWFSSGTSWGKQVEEKTTGNLLT